MVLECLRREEDAALGCAKFDVLFVVQDGPRILMIRQALAQRSNVMLYSRSWSNESNIRASGYSPDAIFYRAPA